jgi:hypothetical protein
VPIKIAIVEDIEDIKNGLHLILNMTEGMNATVSAVMEKKRSLKYLNIIQM